MGAEPDRASGLDVAGYLCGDTPNELGAGFGRTIRAVSQSQTDARRRLRAILADQGNNEAELRSYVSLIGSHGFAARESGSAVSAGDASYS